MTLPDRLTGLARLASENPRISHGDSIIVHQYLDIIEPFLDPRLKLTHNVTLSQPQTASSSAPRPTENQDAYRTNEQLRPQLEGLRRSIVGLGLEFDRRRNESLRGFDLFHFKCQGLEQRITEQESEIREL